MLDKIDMPILTYVLAGHLAGTQPTWLTSTLTRCRGVIITCIRSAELDAALDMLDRSDLATAKATDKPS